MRKLLAAILLTLCISQSALAANPSIGIHNVNTAVIGTTSYTSPSGYTSATTGSSFLVIVQQSSSTAATISDTVNAVSTGNTYSAPTFVAGSNFVHETNDGGYLAAYLCVNCAGGVNHEVTVSSADNIYVVDFIEIQNAALTSPLDQSNGEYTATGTSVCSVTPTVANELIIGAAFSGANGNYPVDVGSSSGFTQLDQFYPNVEADRTYTSAYLAGATAAAHDPAFTYSVGPQAALTLSFKPASAPSPRKSQFFFGG